MSFLAGSILGHLELETGSFEQGFVKAESLMEIFPHLVTSFLSDPVLAFVDLAKEAFSKVFEFVNSSFEESLSKAADIGKVSKNLGVFPEVISSFTLASGSIDATSEAFKFLAKNQADAINGQQAAQEVFQRFGIAFQNADGTARPLAETMNDLSDAMAALPEGSARVDLAMGLLGRTGDELIGKLAQGSAAFEANAAQAKLWGALVGNEAVESASKFKSLESSLSTIWDGIKDTLGEQIRVSLLPALQEFVGWLNDHRENILADIRSFGEIAVDVINIIIAGIENLKGVLAGVAIGGIAGFIAGGPLGAVLGAAAGGVVGGVVNSSLNNTAQPPNTTININPTDASASTGQLATAIQQGQRQQRALFRDDQDRTARQIAIGSGYV